MAMCTDILFRDVIHAIRDTAFVTSDYPIILSFENHCSIRQQYKLAKYCEDIFEDYLLKKPIDSSPLEPGVPLPSPNQLRRKILIKNKRLKPDVEKHQMELFMQGQEKAILEENEDQELLQSPTTDIAKTPDTEQNPDGVIGTDNSTENKAASTDEVTAAPGTALTAEEEAALMKNYQHTGATASTHPYLSTMVNYAQPIKFQGFDVADEKNIHHNMSSFSESMALGVIKQAVTEFVNYNKRQMSRIYPKGGRVDSSNYMPQIFWNAGCQMVALNFQTCDLSMQINQGKFEYNGNCGYLLKPDFMRRRDRTFDPFSESPVDGVIAAHCSVEYGDFDCTSLSDCQGDQVISGQFLSDKKVGTYVEVDMYGLPTDTIRKEFRTRTVPGNGLNPVYNEEPFVFRKVILPDLAVVRIAVYEDTGKLIGQRILPLDGLQTGYRHISLRTEGNFPLSLPTVFCKFVLKTYVPEGFGDFVDALSAPIQFMSAAEKRVKQLQGLGIDEKDISEVSVSMKRRLETTSATTGPPGSGSGQQAGTANNATTLGGGKQPAAAQQDTAGDKEKKDDSATRLITMELILSEKLAARLMRKQRKEIDATTKRHVKERLDMQRQQCVVIEKLISVQDKERQQIQKSGAKKKDNAKNAELDELLESVVNTHRTAVRRLIADQTTDWTELVLRHTTELYGTVRQHLQQRSELFQQVIITLQQQQIKDLETKQERENKELRGRQAKQSVDSAKSVAADKTIKNKAELDRRIRELNENNTKKFIEERKRLAMLQSRQMESTGKLHQEQQNKLKKDIEREIEITDLCFEEAKLAHRPQTVV